MAAVAGLLVGVLVTAGAFAIDRSGLLRHYDAGGRTDYGSIKITKVSQDTYDGKSTVRVDFTWTNTTGSARMPYEATLTDLKAKQNGRELDEAYYSVLDNDANQKNYDNLHATYDPDISVDCWQAYELVDESPVTITYGGWTGTYTLDGVKQ